MALPAGLLACNWWISAIDAACRTVVVRNQLTKGAYIRPVAFRGYGDIGLAPKDDHPVDVAVAAWEWGA